MTKPNLTMLLSVPALLLAAYTAGAQSSTPPDNTRTNRQNDSSMADDSSARSADDQKQNASDIDLTKRIRQSVMADKNLSTYAHNVKIIAVNGTVTLNGVVRSDQEKQEVATKAAQVAGKDHIVNDLKVAPPQ